MVERRVRRWSWGRRIVGAVVVMVLLLWGYAGCVRALENRDGIPADWAIFLGSYDSEVFPDPVETTEQTCTEDLPCRWAVTSDTAVVMMFDDQRDACRAAQTLPATVRQDWIAVRFTPGALTVKQRNDLMAHFANYNRDPDGDFADDLGSWLPWVVRTCS
ncbi:hypothetical protein [Actinomyces sp. 2119]|uniref:hypothetical protein n=1 Tax=Actinomyces sp. 2119 TaxID=2321393 RepID=UPI000E6CDD1B|nr:hypothetical protein [Actinomyces sp. 2119]